MIGLGDIVLPGLLLSFAARYDAAKSLVRKCSQTASGGLNAVGSVGAGGAAEDGGEAEPSPKRYHYHLGRIIKALFCGYFGPLMIAYAAGLTIAYVMVYTTGRAQPALLYLVPLTLGAMLFLGWRRRELSELWSGPKVLKKANRMVVMAGRIPEPAAPNLPNSEVV